MIVTTNALVLKTIDYSESSKICYVFTEDYGLQSLIAKGARKSKSKFSSYLEPISLVQISYYKKSNNSLYTLSEIEYTTHNFNISSNINRLAIGLTICEALYYSSKEENTDTQLFNNTASLIQSLNSGSDYKYILIKFFIVLANGLGHGVNLRWKSSDETTYNPKDNVNVELDNCIITNKSNTNKQSMKLSVSSLIVLKNIINDEAEEIEEFEFQQLTTFFQDFLSYHLEKRLKLNSLNLININ